MMNRSGFTLAEVAATLALLAIAAAFLFPVAADLERAHRANAAAREIGTTLQALRWRSVATNRSHGLYFRNDARGWHWFVVGDGNGNGLRTREVRSGTDPTLSGPHRVEDSVPGARLGFPPATWLPRIPPATGAIRDRSDPVQFGRSDLVSFSPLGRASSGTLYVTDGRHALRGIVLFGPSARVRVWRLDLREGRWRL
jgi:prepilin-type N-terminal cleavage/methylation domain-containing protein